MEFKKGQKVEAKITRSGGKDIQIVGTVKEVSRAFGREDVVIKRGSVQEFVVSGQNVKTYEKLQKIKVKKGA